MSVFLNTNVLLLSFLLFSVFMVLSSDNFFFLWMFMEINLFTFIPLIFIKSLNFFWRFKSGLIYFFFQGLGSFLVIMGLLLGNMSDLVLWGLLLKLGVFPVFWMTPLLFTGNNWFIVFLLGVLQKIMPLFLMSQLPINKFLMFYFLLLFMFFSVLGMYSSGYNLNLIFGWSSIFETCVVLLLLMGLGGLDWFWYFLFYSLMFSLFCYFMSIRSFMSNFYSNKSLLFFWVLLAFFYGLPPFLGFIYKVVFLYNIYTVFDWSFVMFLWLLMFIQSIVYISLFINVGFHLLENYKSTFFNWLFLFIIIFCFLSVLFI